MGFRDSRACDDDYAVYDDDDDYQRWEPNRKSGSGRHSSGRGRKVPRGERRAARRPETDTFRCAQCRTLVGPTTGGGRHRNHCPVCLYSRHVDGPRPGDRASGCRARMEPIGLFIRPSGEQVIVHRCLGCGFERHNRVAADDNPVVLMRLPLLEPRVARGPAAGEATSA